MSEITVQCSDVAWPSEDAAHERAQQDQVVFENVADQYVKGKNVTGHFTVSLDLNINHNEDRIGLIRVGSTNIHECLAFAPIQWSAAESARHGSAVFLASSLPMNDDEFYQFCYVNHQHKSLGSSIPFQLNCSFDDMDLLSSTLSEASLELSGKASNHHDGLITFADRENDDLVVIQTKRTLIEEKLRQENRQLLDMNRRLEQHNDECKAKFHHLDAKSNECINKVKSEMQALVVSHKATVEELSKRHQLEGKLRAEYNACQTMCNQYKTEALQFAERCRALEDTHTQLTNETNRLRSQLSKATRLTEEQREQMADLEKNLMESNELLKTATQQQTHVEQRIRELHQTAEKYQVSMQGQLDAYVKQSCQQENQIHALETANSLLKEELKSAKADNTFLLAMTREDKTVSEELQRHIVDLTAQYRAKNEQNQKELEKLRKEFEQSKGNQSDYVALKNSFHEIEKRCLKHQKGELEAKRQLSVHQEFVGDLERKVHDLAERLSAGGEEYKVLYRKYAALERMIVKAHCSIEPLMKGNPTTLSNETGLNEEALVSLLRNSYELQQQEKIEDDKHEETDDDEEEEKAARSSPSTVTNEEIRSCPMCYWEFPSKYTLENKKEHIDNHFV